MAIEDKSLSLVERSCSFLIGWANLCVHSVQSRCIGVPQQHDWWHLRYYTLEILKSLVAVPLVYTLVEIILHHQSEQWIATLTQIVLKDPVRATIIPAIISGIIVGIISAIIVTLIKIYY